MKVYATGGTQEEAIELRRFCDQKGWEMKLMDRLGRPGVSYDVQKVLNAYRELKKMRVTARGLGMNPGPVYRILKEAGVLEFQTKK